MADLLSQMADATQATEPASSAHKVARNLARSFAVYGIANFAIRALNFLLLIVYARYLQPHDYGIIYMAEIVAAFFVIFEGLSIDSALQRLYFQHNQDAEELRSYLGSSIRFGLVWMLLLLALVLVAGRGLQSYLPASVPFFPYIAMAICTATTVQAIQYRLAIYQAARRPGAYVLLSGILTILTAACCLYEVIVRHGGALGMMRGKLIAALIVFFLATWSMRALLFARFHWKFVRETLSFGLPLIPHLMMASGLVVADRFILEHYRDLSEVGIYSLAYTFGMVMYIVTQSLSQAWLPLFFELAAEREKNHQMLSRICSGLAVLLTALACLGILLSPLFVHSFLDYRYQAAAHIVPSIVMGYLFHALFSLFDLSILQTKRTVSVFMISLAAFLINLILNFIMIPRWGMYGAAWATMIGYAAEAIGAFLLAQRFFSLKYRVPQILIAIAVAGGALRLSQLSVMLTWHGFPLIISAALSLGLIAFIIKRDLRGIFDVLMERRLS